MVKEVVEGTIYSLSTEAPQCPDRRHDQRYFSVLRVGGLLVDGRRELCLIRNVSAGGIMIRPYSPIAVGTPVSIELKHGEVVSGVAQWSDKGLVGVAFEKAIDVLALLNSTGLESRPRMPRIEVRCTATIRHEGTDFRARVVNISQGGICVESPVDLKVDSDVVIKLAGLSAAAGVVKWREGEYHGIGFNRIYPVHELMTFLRAQQQDHRRKVA